MSEYSEQFKDPRWQKFRLAILERDGFKCVFCDDDKNTLHAHHLYYISKRKPWEYPEGCVLTLCEDCHTGYHEVPSEHFDWEILISTIARSKARGSIGVGVVFCALKAGAESPEELIDMLSWSFEKTPTLWVELIKSYRAYEAVRKQKEAQMILEDE